MIVFIFIIPWQCTGIVLVIIQESGYIGKDLGGSSPRCRMVSFSVGHASIVSFMEVHLLVASGLGAAVKFPPD